VAERDNAIGIRSSRGARSAAKKRETAVAATGATREPAYGSALRVPRV